MTLYFVRHHHDAGTCPARDPEMGKVLVEHVTRENARKFGVDLLADAVIAEAEDPEYVENFMQPFRQAGSVEILEASTCEAVVERHGCEPVPAGI
jgi:hypothetical protein